MPPFVLSRSIRKLQIIHHACIHIHTKCLYTSTRSCVADTYSQGSPSVHSNHQLEEYCSAALLLL